MRRNRNTGDNWVNHMRDEVIEYWQRCWGINDVEKRYAHELEQAKKELAGRPKCKRDYGYEPATKWTR